MNHSVTAEELFLWKCSIHSRLFIDFI